MHRIMTVPLAAIVLLALAACSPSAPMPSGEPSADPSPSATPSEAPVDPLTTVTRIQLRADLIYFGDGEAWGVDGFRFDDPIDQVVEKLSTVFDAAPTVTAHDGSLETLPGRWYDWGGFRLHETLTDGAPTVYELHVVEATAAEAHGIAIETVDGIRVGSPMADAAALAAFEQAWSFEYEYQLNPEPVDPASIGESADAALSLYVSAMGALDETGAVQRLSTPLRNWGV